MHQDVVGGPAYLSIVLGSTVPKCALLHLLRGLNVAPTWDLKENCIALLKRGSLLHVIS